MRGHNIYFFPLGEVENVPGLSLLPFIVQCAAVILHIFRLEVVLYVWMCIIRLTCVHISDFKGFLNCK